MRTLSATAAISPAWRHTADLLLRPRRWQTLLKIGAVAVFAQLGGGFRVNLPMGNHHAALPPAFTAMLLTFTLLFAFSALVAGLVLFYVGSRLQFVLFDVVLRRDTRIGPIWSRFGRVTWPWIGLKLLVGLAAILCLLPVLIPAIFYGIKLARAPGGFAHPNWVALLPAILIFAVLILLFAILFSAVLFLLSDFGLPSMALEATPIGVTVRRVFALLRAETAQVLLFLLLRFALGIAGALAAYIGLLLGTLVAGIPLGGIAVGLWFGLHKAGILGNILMGFGWGILGLIFVVLFLAAAIMAIGYLYTFLQAYAIYFLAGRYPLMGEMLDRYTPPPFVYPSPDVYPSPMPYPPLQT